jgi:hypothetical protein
MMDRKRSKAGQGRKRACNNARSGNIGECEQIFLADSWRWRLVVCILDASHSYCFGIIVCAHASSVWFAQKPQVLYSIEKREFYCRYTPHTDTPPLPFVLVCSNFICFLFHNNNASTFLQVYHTPCCLADPGIPINITTQRDHRWTVTVPALSANYGYVGNKKKECCRSPEDSQTLPFCSSMFLTGPLNHFLASTTHQSMMRPRQTPSAMGA